MSPMENHETQRDYWRLMRLRDTNGDQWGLKRLLRLRETNGDQWGLMRLRETTGDS